MPGAFAQEPIPPDSAGYNAPKFEKLVTGSDTIPISDSLQSIHNDSLSLSIINQEADSLPIKPKKNKTIEEPVKYSSRDSMRFDVQEKKMYLFGEAQVDYQSIKLTAGYIELDLNAKTVYAKSAKDSLGKEVEFPVFEDKGQSFETKEMRFNFETKKGLIKDVITKEGDGYIHGESVKKMDNDQMYIKSGKYTTCDNPEPHFHIHASKLKVIPNDKIVTGPAILKVENLPTPLMLPFGFFPNKTGQTSGIILPQYGESANQGFFLNNGGYYFNLNEKMDLSVIGDIYSKGSWALGGVSNYRNRYRFSGLLDARFSNFKFGEPMLRDYRDPVTGQNPYYSNERAFLVRWTHRQDAKARPNSIFSADVNAGTSNYNRLNSFSGNTSNFLTNSMQSNISFSKSWAGKPYNLSLNARHSQATATKDVSVTLPEATFTVNRFFPFKRQVQVGEQKWYEKVGVTYSNQVKNELNTKDSLLFRPESLDQMRNGMMQNSSVSTSFRVMKHFTLSPSINGTNRTYARSINKRWDAETDTLVTDTLNKFSNAFDGNLSTNLSTILYGMAQFKKGPVQAIRHVFTPQVGFTYRPDLGFQHPAHHYTPTGAIARFSPYEIGVFGHPQPGEQGLVNFNFINNLEMKVKSAKDTITGFKKVKIFESLAFSTNHNVFAEEFKWQPLSINGRTQLFNRLDLVFNGIVDPYALSDDTLMLRVNKFEWDENRKLGRFTDGQVALNFSLRSRDTPPPLVSTKGTMEELEMINRNPHAYVDFNIPWNLSVAYVLRYSKPQKTQSLTQSVQFHGDFNLTPKWKFGFNSGYDFIMKDLTYTTLNIYRDLHCWEMVFNWVPFGTNKSYTLDVRVKSPMLQDLKLTRRRSWFDS